MMREASRWLIEDEEDENNDSALDRTYINQNHSNSAINQTHLDDTLRASQLNHTRNILNTSTLKNDTNPSINSTGTLHETQRLLNIMNNRLSIQNASSALKLSHQPKHQQKSKNVSANSIINESMTQSDVHKIMKSALLSPSSSHKHIKSPKHQRNKNNTTQSSSHTHSYSNNYTPSLSNESIDDDIDSHINTLIQQSLHTIKQHDNNRSTQHHNDHNHTIHTYMKQLHSKRIEENSELEAYIESLTHDYRTQIDCMKTEFLYAVEQKTHTYNTLLADAKKKYAQRLNAYTNTLLSEMENKIATRGKHHNTQLNTSSSAAVLPARKQNQSTVKTKQHNAHNDDTLNLTTTSTHDPALNTSQLLNHTFSGSKILNESTIGQLDSTMHLDDLTGHERTMRPLHHQQGSSNSTKTRSKQQPFNRSIRNIWFDDERDNDDISDEKQDQTLRDDIDALNFSRVQLNQSRIYPARSRTQHANSHVGSTNQSTRHKLDVRDIFASDDEDSDTDENPSEIELDRSRIRNRSRIRAEYRNSKKQPTQHNILSPKHVPWSSDEENADDTDNNPRNQKEASRRSSRRGTTVIQMNGTADTSHTNAHTHTHLPPRHNSNRNTAMKRGTLNKSRLTGNSTTLSVPRVSDISAYDSDASNSNSTGNADVDIDDNASNASHASALLSRSFRQRLLTLHNNRLTANSTHSNG